MKKVVKKTVKKIKINKKQLVLAAIILGAIGLLYYFKANLVVAWINNKPIWKISYNQELNRLAGKQAIESLMIKALIKQEAKKQTISISQEELDGEMKKIEEFSQQQGMSLDELLILQGVKKADLLEDIRLQKLVDIMAGTESAQVQEWITNLQTQAKIVKWLK